MNYKQDCYYVANYCAHTIVKITSSGMLKFANFPSLFFILFMVNVFTQECSVLSLAVDNVETRTELERMRALITFVILRLINKLGTSSLLILITILFARSRLKVIQPFPLLLFSLSHNHTYINKRRGINTRWITTRLCGWEWQSSQVQLPLWNMLR